MTNAPDGPQTNPAARPAVYRRLNLTDYRERDQLARLMLSWVTIGYRHAARKAHGLGKVFPWTALLLLRSPLVRSVADTLHRRMIGQPGVTAYLTPNDDALLIVNRKGRDWTVTDHLSANPGTGAGEALRKAAVAELLAEADSAGATIRATTRSPELAKLYMAALPGLAPDRRRWWRPATIHLTRPAATTSEAKLLEWTKGLEFGAWGGVAGAGILFIANGLAAAGVWTPDSPNWNRAVAQNFRTWVLFGSLLVPSALALHQLRLIRRALVMFPKLSRKAWDTASRASRLVAILWLVYLVLAVLFGSVAPHLLGPDVADEATDVLSDVGILDAILGFLGVGSLASLLTTGIDGTRALYEDATPPAREVEAPSKPNDDGASGVAASPTT